MEVDFILFRRTSVLNDLVKDNERDHPFELGPIYRSVMVEELETLMDDDALKVEAPNKISANMLLAAIFIYLRSR